MSIPVERRPAGDGSVGYKLDDGKTRWDLFPVEALNAVADVYTMGARKYADRNWEAGMKWGRMFSAMMRHAWAWWRGETHDPKDGQHHLASVAWCALGLLHYDLHRKDYAEYDDRPKAKDEVTVAGGSYVPYYSTCSTSGFIYLRYDQGRLFDQQGAEWVSDSRYGVRPAA